MGRGGREPDQPQQPTAQQEEGRGQQGQEGEAGECQASHEAVRPVSECQRAKRTTEERRRIGESKRPDDLVAELDTVLAGQGRVFRHESFPSWRSVGVVNLRGYPVYIQTHTMRRP